MIIILAIRNLKATIEILHGVDLKKTILEAKRMDEETMIITKKEYFNLRVTQERMSRLEAGGVDNWEWYGESLHPEDSQSMDEFENELKKELGIK